jgi:hypothetical protein
MFPLLSGHQGGYQKQGKTRFSNTFGTSGQSLFTRYDPRKEGNMKPRSMKEIINKKVYDTKKAELIAGNDYWDGHNFERQGRNTFLYKTKNNNYFAQYLTCWQGERDSLEPLSKDEAISLFEELSEKRVEFEDAFPGVELVEA